MMKTKGKEIYSKPGMRAVGIWATVWWGVSCLYILLWVWAATPIYARTRLASARTTFFATWKSSLSLTHNYPYLRVIKWVIVIGWVVGAYIWLKRLKQNKISYKVALKDLFLTIRK